MSLSSNPQRLLVAGLCAIHLGLGLSTITALSPTYDEPVHLAAGYSFLRTGDYRLDGFAHAPLAQVWAALPLLVIKPQLPVQHPYWNEIPLPFYPFADIFLYKNRIDAAKILTAGRFMILLLSLALGLMIYFFSKEIFGNRAALIALFLWCFAPFFLANGTLVTTDLALTLFYFTAVFILWRWLRDLRTDKGGALFRTVLLGASIGCALLSKQSAVALVPVLGFILLYSLVWKRVVIPHPVLVIAMISIGIVAVMALVYGGNSPSIYYWAGLWKVLGDLAGGRPTFLMGRSSASGWGYYFPAVFLLKTPIALLLMLGATLFVRRLWTSENILFVLWPATFYFIVSCFSTVQIGHRHILPVYPFLIVWASGLCSAASRKTVVALGFVGLLWYGTATMRAHPWHLSYFNETIGSLDNGYAYLTDSNVDWGQGLKALGAYLQEEQVTGIYLSYFGTADPALLRHRLSPLVVLQSSQLALGV